MKKIKEKISLFSNIKIFTHKNPDGDAIGSMLALEKILSMGGKGAEMLVFGPIDDQFSFLPGFNRIKSQEEFSDDNDSLFIYIDCASPSRTGFDLSLFEGKECLIIDHHPLNPGQADYSGIIDPVASSTAEVIFYLANELKWKTDRDVNFCLLAGILSDTGTLQHANTSPKALTIVSRLVQNGINLKKIADSLFKKKETGGALKIWGEILARAAIDERTKMAFSYVSEEDFKKYNTSEDELDGLVNLLAGIPESRFSLLLTEKSSGKIKGSLRSEPSKGIDVSKIAQSFGGGGHKLAAGFETDGKIKERMEEIKNKIAKEIKIY